MEYSQKFLRQNVFPWILTEPLEIATSDNEWDILPLDYVCNPKCYIKRVCGL